MDSTGQDGAQLLAPLRDTEPATLSTVDVPRAVRVGTRRRRTRQALSAAAAAAVVALVLAVIPAIVDARHDSAPATQVSEFDVLRQHLTVGSAGGFTPVSYESGRLEQLVRLVPAPDSQQGTPGRASVTLYASGRAPVYPERQRAPDVYGHRAYWVTTKFGPAEGAGKTGTTLMWEWAPDAWVVVEVESTEPGVQDLVFRVAMSVRTDANTPVRVPFTAEPPDPIPAMDLQLTGVITPYGTGTDVRAGALLVWADLDQAGASERLLIGVRRDLGTDFVTGTPRVAPDPTTQVDGRQANIADKAVTIFDVGGGWSAVAEAGADITVPLVDWAGSLRLVDDPEQQDSWTADPVR